MKLIPQLSVWPGEHRLLPPPRFYVSPLRPLGAHLLVTLVTRNTVIKTVEKLWKNAAKIMENLCKTVENLFPAGEKV